MIDRLNEVLGSKAPSMTFMPESQIRQLYEEHVVSDKTEIVYEEVVRSFFGVTKGFQCGDVLVTKESLMKIYKPLNLKPKVFNEVLKAHDGVIEYGNLTKDERVIVIDRDTGEIVADEEGSNGTVNWDIDDFYKGEIITVHNHSGSTPFSAQDLYSFNRIIQTRMMTVQCHNGVIYSAYKPILHRYKDLTKEIVVKELLVLGRQVGISEKKGIEKKEAVVYEFLDELGWKLRKEGRHEHSDSSI